MATVKETRITDKSITVGIDEFDSSKVVVTLSANTRQSDGTLVTTYQRDITDMVDQEVAAALSPLLLKAIQRVMTDHSITTTDLEEGHTWVKDNRSELSLPVPINPGVSADLSREASNEGLPPVIDPDEVMRRHFKEIEEQTLKAEEARIALQAQLEEEEQARLKNQGAVYEQEQARALKESTRIEKLRDHQQQRDTDQPAAQRRIRPRSRPTT